MGRAIGSQTLMRGRQSQRVALSQAYEGDFQRPFRAAERGLTVHGRPSRFAVRRDPDYRGARVAPPDGLRHAHATGLRHVQVRDEQIPRLKPDASQAVEPAPQGNDSTPPPRLRKVWVRTYKTVASLSIAGMRPVISRLPWQQGIRFPNVVGPLP